MPQTRYSLGSELSSNRSVSSGSKSADVLLGIIGEIERIGHHPNTGGRGWIDLPEGFNDSDSVAAG